MSTSNLKGWDARSGEWRGIHMDRIRGGLETIVTEHLSIHKGDAYSCSVVTSDNAVANGGRYQVLLFNPSSFSFPHIRVYEWDTESSPAVIGLFESPTVQATGTICPTSNLNRVSSNVSSISVFTASSVDVTSRGARLEEHLISGAKSTGGSEENATVEWILKPATNYLFDFQNNSGAASDVGFFTFWYE